MMDAIRGWLIGITAAAMIAALAEGLSPEGPVKRIVKLSGGLLMVIVMVQPLLHLDYTDMSSILVDYQVKSSGYSRALETENIQLIKSIIEDQTSAYIQDKAAELGITCVAEVTCQVEDDGDPYPAAVVVFGDLDQGQVKQLRRIIEGELAIPESSQRYERMTKQ